MNKFRFQHEKTKKEQGIENHVSTPEGLAQLLTKLLGIDEVEGKVIYDACFGTGSLSQYVDTSKNILIGDDREIKYLQQGQKNNPKAILFNHDIWQCLGPPCYQHLIIPKWKEKVEAEIKQRESKLDEQEIKRECDKINALNLTDEQIKEMLFQKEAELKQKCLEWLIKQEVEKKKSTKF